MGIDKYINVMLKIQTSTQKNPLMNLINSDTMCSSKIAVFCAVEQFQKNLKNRCSTSKVSVPFHSNTAVLDRRNFTSVYHNHQNRSLPDNPSS